MASALIGGGISLYLPTATAPMAMCLGLLLSILLGVSAVAESDREHNVLAGVLSLVVMPQLLFLYQIGLGVAREDHLSIGFLPLAAGIALLGFALRPSKSTGGSVATSGGHVAHA
jgi:hypothetical protein